MLTESDNEESSIKNWDGLLSKYLAQFVKEGVLSYKELNIEDESRNRDVKSYFSFSPYRNIVISVEKDITYKLVRDISDLIGCSCYSSKGLELDAFAPDRIRDIFASSLKNYIDTRNYLDECRKEYLNNAVYKAIRPYIDKIVQNLVGQKQNDVKIMDFDILDYARKGYSYLTSDEVCCLTDNNIDKLVKDYFRNSRLIYDQSI